MFLEMDSVAQKDFPISVPCVSETWNVTHKVAYVT